MTCGNKDTLEFWNIGKEVDAFYSTFYDLEGLDIMTICNYDEMAAQITEDIDITEGKEGESLYAHMHKILDSTSADSLNKPDLSMYSKTTTTMESLYPEAHLNKLNIREEPSDLKKLAHKLTKPLLRTPNLSEISLI